MFTDGDSRDINTWSNVPYMFTTALENKGVKVNRVNIKLPWLASGIIGKVYNHIRYAIYRDGYGITRTKLYRYLVGRVIKNAIEKYPNANYHLFLTISFNDTFSGKPNIHFFDWTYYIQRERYGYKLSKDEMDYCKYENDIINHACAVFPMFKKSFESIIADSENPHIYHLNRNVVNDLGDFDINQLPKWTKERKRNILFVGRKAYIKGCRVLLEAYKRLKEEVADLGLCIVGMTEKDFDEPLPEGVKCYGYLHKNIESQRITYYSLLKNCITFCNPSSYWGGVLKHA